MLVLKMWCPLLIILLTGSGIAVADESNESNRSTSKTEDSVRSNEAYNDNSQPTVNSREDYDNLEEEKVDLETTTIGSYNNDSSFGNVLNNTFLPSVQIHEMIPNRTKTEYGENDSVSVKQLYVDPSQSYKITNDKDGTSVSDKARLQKHAVVQFFDNATHTLAEDKNLNPELFPTDQEIIFNNTLIDDSTDKDNEAIEYTTEKVSNDNNDTKKSTTTLPSIELDTVEDVLEYSSNSAITSLPSDVINTDHDDANTKKPDSNYSYTTITLSRDDEKYTDTYTRNPSEMSSVPSETVTDNLTYIQNAVSEIYTDTTSTTFTKPNIASDDADNSEFVTTSIGKENATTDDDVASDDRNNIFDKNLEFTTSSFVKSDLITSYSKHTETGKSKTVDKKHTTPSSIKLVPGEYSNDDNIPFPNEQKVFINNITFPFELDDINETAEEIFNDKSYKFPTTEASSNVRGILEMWLREQKQKNEQDSGAINAYTTTTDAAVDLVHIQTDNRLKTNDPDVFLQEHLKNNAEIRSYSYGRIVDDTDASCILLNSTYKIFLNGSQIKLPIQYNTFSNNNNNGQNIIFNAGDESGNTNVSIKFNVSCTKQSCSIIAISVLLRNKLLKIEILSERKNLSLFQTDYGFASENEDKLTYIMNKGIVLEVDHAKFHVMKHCNVAKSLDNIGQRSYYKEIIGGSFAVFILAALGTYTIIRNNRKKKLVLGV